MAELNPGGAGRTLQGLLQPKRWHWSLARLGRELLLRFGYAGVLVPLVIVWGLAALGVQAFQARALAHVRAELERQPPLSAAATTPRNDDSAEARLTRFNAALKPRVDIPVVVGALLTLAESGGLVIAKGEYRPQVDATADLMRYRMTFPLRGPAAKVLPYVQRALEQEPALALESLRIKRDWSGASEVEAELRWVLFAQITPREAP